MDGENMHVGGRMLPDYVGLRYAAVSHTRTETSLE